jgi:probable HAF family extracellular repeat protein
MEDLGTIPAQNVSYGFAISGNGLVIGGGPSSAGAGHAFIRTAAGGLVDVGVLPGAPEGATSAIYGLDADGSFGAGFSGSPDGDRAILWSNDRSTMESLGALPGGVSSKANAISADGAAITGFSDSASGQRAFRWTRSTGMIDLGILAGRSNPSGDAISADGSVVVGHDDTGAILWTSAAGMVDLHTYLTSRGVNMTGWTLTGCNGISADRTALAGSGRLNGAARGWVVRGLPPITCAADFDGSGAADVPDIFAFLSDWFALASAADFDKNGTVEVPDIFAFLSAWFAGCP